MLTIPSIGAPFRINASVASSAAVAALPVAPVAVHAAAYDQLAIRPARPANVLDVHGLDDLAIAAPDQFPEPMVAHPTPILTGAADDYFGRLMKLLPTEIVALYLTFKGAATNWPEIWAAICLVLVVIFRIVGTNRPEKGNPIQLIAVLIAAVSFILWIYAMGGYIFQMQFLTDNPVVISVAIGVWTVLLPKLYKGD